MNISYVFSYLIVCFGVFTIYYGYKILSRRQKEKIEIRQFLLILLFSLFQFYIGLSSLNYYKIVINLFLNVALITVLYKDNFKRIFITVLLLYIIEIFLEIIYSFLFLFLNFNSSSVTSIKTLIIRDLFSMLIVLNLILLLSFKKIKKIIKKFLYLILIKQAKIVEILLIIFYCFIIYIMIVYTVNISLDNYYTNLVSMIIIMCSIFISIKYKDQIIYIEEKQKIILDYMRKYEFLIDKYRINKHEMLNNLILLNSYKNKNSSEYKKLLKKMIINHSISNIDYYRNIGYLPSGIKGILYYKINIIENSNLKFTFNCIKNLNQIINEEKTKEYAKLCKMLNIFLDNSIEAARKSKEKVIIVDIYKDKNKIIFYIENSLKGNINIHLIEKKYYSSKGKNRGIGLFLAKKISISSKKIKYNQFINNNKHFVTILEIIT